MKNQLNLFTLLIVVSSQLNAQVDSTAIFEKAKKHLLHPVNNFKQLITCNSRTPGRGEVPDCRHIYYTNKAETVSAIFEGKVVRIFELANRYGVIIKFGKYFITYYGMDKPVLKKGQYVYCQDKISTISATTDNEYRLELNITTPDGDLNPADWIN